MSKHTTHKQHEHAHSATCGHEAIQHEGHTDYAHDGHSHHAHEGHWDECPAATQTDQPSEEEHAHGPEVGPTALEHGGHVDYIPAARRHPETFQKGSWDED